MQGKTPTSGRGMPKTPIRRGPPEWQQEEQNDSANYDQDRRPWGPFRSRPTITNQRVFRQMVPGGQDLGVEGAPMGMNPEGIGAEANKPPPKPKVYQFDYRYDDTDTVMAELDEFYHYAEVPLMELNANEYKSRYPNDLWTELPAGTRRARMEQELDLTESLVESTRRAAQRRLLYLLQGCFEETTSPEMQLHWIMENARTLRALDGVPALILGLRNASNRYTATAEVHAGDTSANENTERTETRDARLEEFLDVLGMLYFVVEVFRSDETFAEELMATSPPLPLLLFQMVAGLKDRLPKSYPHKQVLLLLWKTILACLGGMKEVSAARALSRELAGLRVEDKNFTKASPQDITSWRRDTSVKYPTFAPPTSLSTSVPNEKLAEGVKPIPSRPNYHSTDLPPPSAPPKTVQNHPPPTHGQAPLPGTPAPSPPASPAGPRARKQQFQTDPNKPFVFPYTRASDSNPASLVPFAVAEADRLFHRHAYVPLGLLQMWEIREECMREERGLGRAGLIGFTSSYDDEDDQAELDMMERDMRYDEEEQTCLAQGDKAGAKLARDKKAAAKRLYRVEVIYKNTLPILQSCVIVMLKLLLATVTGAGAGGAAGNLANTQMLGGIQSPTSEAPPENSPPPTQEEIDAARHREITSKAISAIFCLLLKWFKASHVLKFHFLGQLLFDSNCFLLVLKMFGLSDVFQTVQAKNECPDLNFFRYCHLNFPKGRPQSPEDSMLHPPTAKPVVTSPRVATSELPGIGASSEKEEIIVCEYSSRNFFSSINFLKILQKMVKHQSYRTWMMNYYKSSQILKRMLRVTHPMMQLQVLKLIKSQMPWCGRRWRQNNMKVITAIYLNCRPELRDDWLAGTDGEFEAGAGGGPQEDALRWLIQYYNKRYYSAHMAALSSPEPAHKRSDSISAVTLEEPIPRPGISAHRPSITDPDVFPPRKTDAGAAYNPDEMIEFWLHEYEDVLMEVFGDGERDDEWGSPAEDFGLVTAGKQGHRGAPGPAESGDRAWSVLEDIMGDGESISDSESVVSVGELGDEARLDEADGVENGIFARQQRRRSTDNEKTWEELSPTTLSLLPRSPAERRRSSSGGSPLRPVMPSTLLGGEVFDDEDDLPGPMPIERQTEDERERSFGAVDEVEYAYGE